MFVSPTFHFPSFYCFFRRCCKNKCSNKSNSDDQLDSCRDHCEEEASCSEASSSSDSGGGSCSSKIRDCCDCIEDECSKESGDSADKARAFYMFIFIRRTIFSPHIQLCCLTRFRFSYYVIFTARQGMYQRRMQE